MKRFRITDPSPAILDLDLTVADIMSDLDPAWFAEFRRLEEQGPQ